MGSKDKCFPTIQSSECKYWISLSTHCLIQGLPRCLRLALSLRPPALASSWVLRWQVCTSMLNLIILCRISIPVKQPPSSCPLGSGSPQSAFSLFLWIHLVCIFPTHRPMVCDTMWHFVFVVSFNTVFWDSSQFSINQSSALSLAVAALGGATSHSPIDTGLFSLWVTPLWTCRAGSLQSAFRSLQYLPRHTFTGLYGNSGFKRFRNLLFLCFAFLTWYVQLGLS